MRVLVHLLLLTVFTHRTTQGQVISKPDGVTICEGREAVFTCVLNGNKSDDVQWYRFIKNTSTTEMVDHDGNNIYFITDTIGNATNSSLTITNVIKSYTGYFWVGTSSLTVCNASLTVLTRPSTLTVNIMKNIDNSSIIVLQWDAVDDSLTTTYTIQWTRFRDRLKKVATVIEQTSYTITGLILDTVYNITVTAANKCGSGPDFSTSISLSTDITSTTSSISTASSTILMNITSTAVTSAISITATTDIIGPSNSMTVTDNKNIGITSTISSVATTIAITSVIHTDLSSTNPADTTTNDGNSNSNIPIIAGAAIGGIIVMTIIIVLIIICCWWRKNAEKSNYNDLSGDDTTNKNIIPVLLSSLNPNDKHEKPKTESSCQGIIGTQQSMEYALIDDSKMKKLKEYKQQNGEAVDILGQPMEYAITEVANVKKNNRKEDKQNGGTDTKHEQPLQYAVVDKSKKKSRKDDKQQNVDYDGASNSTNQSKNKPLIHYAVLDTLPTSTDAYNVADNNSRTQYALVTQT